MLLDSGQEWPDYLLEREKDVLGLDFADLSFKEVHAGHLFKVGVSTTKMDIDDMKSGSMNMAFRPVLERLVTLPGGGAASLAASAACPLLI